MKLNKTDKEEKVHDHDVVRDKYVPLATSSKRTFMSLSLQPDVLTDNKPMRN